MKFCLWLGLATTLLAQSGVDQNYTNKIREYTTSPEFLTELVDHLPAHPTIPTPEKVLGYIAGTPYKLTHASKVHEYFRALDRATPRVSVFNMGLSEEGREMIVACISSETNLAKLDRHKELMARLADPRKTPPAKAAALMKEVVPMYYLTGSLHSTETGSPEMLMELAYRLAVEDSELIRAIRDNLIVMITPVTDVDGRERMVDLYNWRRAHENQASPSLIYWGKYVAHDNNRDGMSLSLALTRNVWKAFFDYHPLVLHDLHESVPFLYVSTGMGPYNAWYDPVLISEWQKLAYHEVEGMTKRGVPGVWTHGFYDGWAANYMFLAANGHNAIGRFYETFGNGGADTKKRTVPATSTTRTWFRPNPPYPEVNWSIRNNVNLQQSAALLALNYTARNKAEFVENFYKKSQRSVAKATTEGPAAYVIPGDTQRPGMAADLLRIMDLQGVEFHQLTAEAEVSLKTGNTAAGKRKFPAGSFVIRMDQPYSRMADMLLDLQYYSANDTRPYDDTGWSLGYLRNVETVRVTDPAILAAPMKKLQGMPALPTTVSGTATPQVYLLSANADLGLATFRYALKNVKMTVAEEAFTHEGKQYPAGTVILPAANLSRAELDRASRGLGLRFNAANSLPTVKQHELVAARLALVHTWINTQNEGWVRLALEAAGVPYDYISDQKLSEIADLRAKYDVILFGPVGGSSQRIVNGIPKRAGEPAIPWKASELTPSFGTGPDQTDDIRGGMGLEGLVNLRKFIEAGGLFITIQGNASIPIDYGLVEGVSIAPTPGLQVSGSVLSSYVADKASPIVYGYDEKIPLYFRSAPVFRLDLVGPAPANLPRPTGRGGPNDPDVVQGRPFQEPPARQAATPGQEPPIPADMREQMRAYLPPDSHMPRVIVRWAAEKDLLISGMLAGGGQLAHKPAIVQVPVGQGNVLLFGNNPMWRHQTQGSWPLVFNALMNFAHLHVSAPAGVKAK
ncbi:MAG: M14 family zinc carboxypeptidase [Bryobacter sp.]|nr:M14 family zinc carboxypeptidase [Bryobacter sp.]